MCCFSFGYFKNFVSILTKKPQYEEKMFLCWLFCLPWGKCKILNYISYSSDILILQKWKTAHVKAQIEFFIERGSHWIPLSKILRVKTLR